MSYDPRLSSAADLKVSVKNGVVKIEGEVNTLTAREAASAVSKSTVGVTGLENWLKVRSAPVGDAKLQTRIADSLRLNAYTNAKNIDVEVRDAVAYLSGTVSSEVTKTEAGESAGAITGVKKIVNQIAVRPVN